MFSGLGEGQLANQGDHLGGPPATDFKAKDGKAAPRGVVEFRVGLGAFASRGFLDGGAGVGVGPPAGQSISSDRADQGRVHCHLGSMPQGQAVHAEVFTGEGDLRACRAYGEGSARVGPGLGQQKCARRGVKVRKKRGGRIAVGC